jgi:ubiquinone/menaquinone biosynthesis C-methylase UbiE
MTQSLTTKVARQYNSFQSTLEEIDWGEKYLNYGYTLSNNESLGKKQEQLCRVVFDAADIQPEDELVDVGFGSGEQDFLLADNYQFRKLTGFNIADKQVDYANARASMAGLSDRLSFVNSPAENMQSIDDASVDKVLSVECAFYFDRPRFYQEAARVLKPGGLLVLADIAFCNLLIPVKNATASLRRVGAIKHNRRDWEHHFTTRSVTKINSKTRQGCQMAVFQILKEFSNIPRADLVTWLSMALSSQVVVLGLWLHLLRYDLIVLEKK